ncbi:hypothetical protein PACTADRAFT_48742 [Pachysolen tannophilus NRRL Y-2460]|uniref:Proteasome activator Blm10 mid region domain-containing protein n=1 Tax=Pachysolen tannophilus NRRL Y-2460 TaxID=669874 RepID=A0A1E4TYZ1_PACTA|nr:hypothetical protein PACTADRAFT_48742 [Pachysolen tannophilus NRRL Y-2460]
MDHRIKQPIPLKRLPNKDLGKSLSVHPRYNSPLARSSSAFISENPNADDSFLPSQQFNNRSITPSAGGDVRYQSTFLSIESSRIHHYKLDFPEDNQEASQLQLDQSCDFYSKDPSDEPDLPSLLPYNIETVKDKARYLSHIVSHLYIAINSLDLAGAISISAKDLASLKNNLISDIDLALETDLFDSNFNAEETIDDIEDDSGDESEGNDDNENEGENKGRSTPVTKLSPKSAAIINTRSWTIELKTLIKMKYDIPFKLRASLAKVYYAVCLSKGQFLNLDLYIEVFQLLTKDREILKELGLVLDWKPMYDELISNFPHPDYYYDFYDKEHFRKLIQLSFHANFFFDKDAVSTIASKVFSKFSTTTGSMTMSAFYALVPMSFKSFVIDDNKIVHFDKNDVRYYIPSLFHIWSTVARLENIDMHIVVLISRIAEYSLVEYASNPDNHKKFEFGTFGIFTEAQFKTLMENLSKSLNIMTLKSSNRSSTYYQAFANLIVFSMIGDRAFVENGVLETLSTLINAIKTYVHPSNAGSWSSPISKLIQLIVSQYHKRLQMERPREGRITHKNALSNLNDDFKLNNKITSKMVDIFIPVIQVGIHSKKDSISNNYIEALNLLCYSAPKLVLDKVLIDCYSSLDNVMLNHRLKVVLKELSVLSRYMVELPVYRVHVVRILSLALPGIDSNDLIKTLQTLYLIGSVGSFIPFADMSDDSGDGGIFAMNFTQQHLDFLEQKFYKSNNDVSDTKGFDTEEFPYDPELEQQALYSASSSFKDFIKSFCSKVFDLLGNLPDPRKNSGVESKIIEALPGTVQILMESLSDDCYETFSNEFYDYVANNVHYTVSDAVASIVASIVKRDPKTQFSKFIKLLIPKIREEIDENGAGSIRGGDDILPRDQPLLWNIVILSGAVSFAGEELLQHRTDLTELSIYVMQKVRGPVSLISPILLYQMLNTLTCINLKENRLISEEALLKNDGKVTEKFWGGFQFSKERFNRENLKFHWHIPTPSEVDFAISCFELHVKTVMENIQQSMSISIKDIQETSKALEYTDKFNLHLLYLAHGIAGISSLLYPSSREILREQDGAKFQSLEQRLMVLKNIRKLAAKNDSPKLTKTESYSVIGDFQNPKSPLISSKQNQKENSEESLDGVSKDIRKEEDEIVDPNKLDDELVDYDQTNNIDEAPISGRVTPSVSHPSNSDNSALNPSLTFREQKLYTCHYFFGDENSTRIQNLQYVKLHELRNEIGNKLHEVFEFLNVNHPNNTKLFKILLHTIRIWITDAGADLVMGYNNYSSIKYDFIESVQCIKKVTKPFTRLAFGARLEKYHNQRVGLFVSSRFTSDLDRILLKDVVKLSASAYSDIAKPASITLFSSLKSLLGTYALIIKQIFQILRDAIAKEDYKVIQSTLRLLQLRRIKNKIMSDFIHTPELILLLLSCMKADDVITSELACVTYKSIAEGFKLPSSVCVIDHNAVNSIKPPDSYIDLEVRAVKLAKDQKRELFAKQIQKIVAQLLENTNNTQFWKINLYNLIFLVNIETDIEVQTNPEVLVKFHELSKSSHPAIARLCFKGITKVYNKFSALSSYNYDFERFYVLDYVPNETLMINTRPNGAIVNYKEEFYREMSNFDSPHYFIDNKSNFSWLFWGDGINVIKNEAFIDLNLHDKEVDVLKKFGDLVTKDWIKSTLNLLIQDNESDGSFHSTDVFLIAGIIRLMANGYINNLKFEEILEIIDELYIKDEKGNQIIVCELFCGLLIASRSLTEDLKLLRDNFLAEKLSNIFSKDLSPDNSGVWIIFSWWLPSHVDVRRFPNVIKVLLDFKINRDTDSAFKEATKLSFVKSFATVTSWRFPERKRAIEECFSNLDHPYRYVREQIGTLICVLFIVNLIDPFPDSESYFETNNEQKLSLGMLPFKIDGYIEEKLITTFVEIEKLRIDIENLSVQEIIKSSYFNKSRTILYFLKHIMVSSSSVSLVPYMKDYIFPFLLKLGQMRDVCKLANISPASVFVLIAQIPYRIDQNQEIINLIVGFNSSTATWHSTILVLTFAQVFYIKKYLSLTKDQHSLIFEFIYKLLFNETLEVRESAANTFTGIIHITPEDQIDERIEYCINRFTKILNKYRKTLNKNENNNEISIKLHGATLGLGALVKAFPYVSPIPKWLPSILTTLANKSSNLSGIVGKSAKNTLSDFKKNRKDTWHIDSKFFTEEELQDLEGVLWKSYFV